MRVSLCRAFVITCLLLVSLLAVAPPCPAAERASATLLVLGKPDCFNCRLMLPVLERLREEYQGRVVFSFVDVAANPEQARVFQLRKTPTLVFYDGQQQEVGRHAGYMERTELMGALDKVLAAGEGRGR